MKAALLALFAASLLVGCLEFGGYYLGPKPTPERIVVVVTVTPTPFPTDLPPLNATPSPSPTPAATATPAPTPKPFSVNETIEAIEANLSRYFGATVRLRPTTMTGPRDAWASDIVRDSAGKNYLLEFRRRASYTEPYADEVPEGSKELDGRTVGFFYFNPSAPPGGTIPRYEESIRPYNQVVVYGCSARGNTYLAMVKTRASLANDTAVDGERALQQMFFDCS
jgi:hypothetical protein